MSDELREATADGEDARRWRAALESAQDWIWWAVQSHELKEPFVTLETIRAALSAAPEPAPLNHAGARTYQLSITCTPTEKTILEAAVDAVARAYQFREDWEDWEETRGLLNRLAIALDRAAPVYREDPATCLHLAGLVGTGEPPLWQCETCGELVAARVVGPDEIGPPEADPDWSALSDPAFARDWDSPEDSAGDEPAPVQPNR